MKVIKYQLLLALALLVGVAIGFSTAGDGNRREPSAQRTESAAKGAVEDVGAQASLNALRKRVAELEKLLAENDKKSEVAISNAVAEAVRNAPQSGRPHGNPREWLENLKKTDPVPYTQMTNRFAQWRARRADQARTKIDFLSSIDTSHMSAAARKTHNDLQELIARREEIDEQLHQEDLSDEERGRLMEELHRTHHELQRLNGEERKNLITETARSLGFEGEAVQEISTTLQEVIQATDSGMGRPHGPPPPGGPGPGGPRGR